MKKQSFKNVICIILTAIVFISAFSLSAPEVSAKSSKVAISKSEITVKPKKTVTLTLNNAKKKVTWKIYNAANTKKVSKKSVQIVKTYKVKKAKSAKVKLKGIKAGVYTIRAKSGKKTYMAMLYVCKNHSYTASYTWADDGSSCTAVYSCKGCKDVKATETASILAGTVTTKVTTKATEDYCGVTQYTAKFTNSYFKTQKKKIEDIPRLESTESSDASGGTDSTGNGTNTSIEQVPYTARCIACHKEFTLTEDDWNAHEYECTLKMLSDSELCDAWTKDHDAACAALAEKYPDGTSISEVSAEDLLIMNQETYVDNVEGSIAYGYDYDDIMALNKKWHHFGGVCTCGDCPDCGGK